MKKIKSTAKAAMRGKYLSAIPVLAVPVITAMAITAAQLAANIYILPYYSGRPKELIITLSAEALKIILVYPMITGQKYCFYRNYLYGDFSTLDLFHFFKSQRKYLAAAAVNIFKFIFVAVCSAVFILPPLMLLKYLIKIDASVQLLTLGGILAAAGLFAVICSGYSLFLADYFVIIKKCSPLKSIFYSIKYMRGSRRKLVLLRLSFMPLFISCIFIVPIFYAAPLYRSASAVLANRIICLYPRAQARRGGNVLSNA